MVVGKGAEVEGDGDRFRLAGLEVNFGEALQFFFRAGPILIRGREHRSGRFLLPGRSPCW